MIKIIYDNDYRNLKITGHANHADYGKDIVCASVSSIVITSINLSCKLNDQFKFTDDGNKIEINNDTNDETVKLVLSNMIELLAELEKQYPKNIKISKGE